MNSQSAVNTPAWLTYPLVDGFIHDWLTAGPVALPVHDLDKFTGADYKLQIARSRYRPTSEVDETPLERAAFSPSGAETPLMWRALSLRRRSLRRFFPLPPHLSPLDLVGLLPCGQPYGTDGCGAAHHQRPPTSGSTANMSTAPSRFRTNCLPRRPCRSS
ncbi:MAG: hypothetical protein R2873_18100 [Caldilineaceae bacterium]